MVRSALKFNPRFYYPAMPLIKEPITVVSPSVLVGLIEPVCFMADQLTFTLLFPEAPVE